MSRTTGWKRFAIAALMVCSACVEDVVEGRTPGSPVFDGAHAHSLVEQQVGFGPRIPGTPGHRAQADWMIGRLGATGAELLVDSFTHTTAEGVDLYLVNVMARFRPELGRRIVILAHWDTRPRSDMAEDPGLRGVPVPGANDGGSGTAVVLALAEMLDSVPPPLGVDLLLVDGEDYGPGADDMLLGSRRYAASLTSENAPIYGVLLDMVGDADPLFPIEANSAQFAPIVVNKVWRAAKRLGLEAYFPDRVGPRLTDDHIPLIQAGVPTIDVIDFSYGPGNGYWHTPEDRLEHVSASTLGMVGSVVTELIYSGG